MPPRLLIVYTAGQVIPYFSAWEIQGVAWERVNWLQHIMIQGQCRVQWRMRVTSLPEEAQVSRRSRWLQLSYFSWRLCIWVNSQDRSAEWLVWASVEDLVLHHGWDTNTPRSRAFSGIQVLYIHTILTIKKRDISKFIYCYSDLIRTQIIQIRDFMYFL